MQGATVLAAIRSVSAPPRPRWGDAAADSEGWEESEESDTERLWPFRCAAGDPAAVVFDAVRPRREEGGARTRPVRRWRLDSAEGTAEGTAEALHDGMGDGSAVYYTVKALLSRDGARPAGGSLAGSEEGEEDAPLWPGAEAGGAVNFEVSFIPCYVPYMLYSCRYYRPNTNSLRMNNVFNPPRRGQNY